MITYGWRRMSLVIYHSWIHCKHLILLIYFVTHIHGHGKSIFVGYVQLIIITINDDYTKIQFFVNNLWTIWFVLETSLFTQRELVVCPIPLFTERNTLKGSLHDLLYLRISVLKVYYTFIVILIIRDSDTQSLPLWSSKLTARIFRILERFCFVG